MNLNQLFRPASLLLLTTVSVWSGSAREAKAQTLDSTWLTKALSQISSPAKLSEVKTIYLNPRFPHALPVKDGIQLIDKAYAAERVGSKRWFALASARCYGNLRFSYAPKARVANDYAALFAKANVAPKVGAESIMRASVDDVIAVTLARGVRKDIPEMDDLNLTRLAAWDAFVITENYRSGEGRRPTSWIKTFEVLGYPTKTIDSVVKNINNPNWPRTFNLRGPMAMAYLMRRDGGTDEARKMLLATKALIPLNSDGTLDNSRANSEDVASFYASLIWALRGNGREQKPEVELVLSTFEEALKAIGSGKDESGIDLLMSFYDEYLEDPAAKAKRMRKLTDSLATKSVGADLLLEIANKMYSNGFSEINNKLSQVAPLEAALRLTRWIESNPQTYGVWSVAEARLMSGTIYRALGNQSAMVKSLNLKWPVPKNEEEKWYLADMQTLRAFLLKPHPKFRRARY